MDEEWTFAGDSNPEEEPELTFAAEPAADGEPPSFRMDELGLQIDDAGSVVPAEEELTFADDLNFIDDAGSVVPAEDELTFADDLNFINDAGSVVPADGPDPQNLRVFFAAQSGNTALVRSLLETLHLSPGILDPDGNTLLHHAAESGSPELVAFLLEAGLDPRTKGAARLTALERAAWQGDLEIVRLLVEAGADVNSEGGRWSAPLAEAGKPVCEAVFLYGPPLYAAASRGHLPVVRYLVSQGADINGRDCNGRTVLHAASRAENPDCMQFLLSLGAE